MRIKPVGNTLYMCGALANVPDNDSGEDFALYMGVCAEMGTSVFQKNKQNYLYRPGQDCLQKWT